jgi:hypothetical protein
MIMSPPVNSMMTGMAMDAAQTAQQDAQRAQNEIERLRKDVERLLLITEALWLVLKEQNGFTDEKLTQLMTQIDLRDGQLDGRVAKTQAEACPHCGRTLAKNLTCCMYCGKPVLDRNPFAR